MARMLWTEYNGEWFYYNDVSGGTLSGFGTQRLFNVAAGLNIKFNSANGHVDNWGSNVNIYNNYKNNWINNDGGNNVKIYAYKGSYDISNQRGKNVEINALGDSPYTINNTDSGLNGSGTPDNVTIITGDGNNFVYNQGNHVEITTGAGDDTINNNCGTHIEIHTGAGNDKIENHISAGTNVTIFGEDGNDTVENCGSKVKIYGGANNDDITNEGSKVTIDGGDNDDHLYNRGGSNVSIGGGSGSNTIKNGHFEGHFKLPEKEGEGIKFIVDESIQGGDFVTMIGGEDDDKIQTFGGKNITIDTGDGKNLVSLGGIGENISVEGGDGDDSIYGYVREPLYIADDQPRTLASGKYVTINTGSGNNLVTLGNTWSCVTINGGNSAAQSDVVKNEAVNALIQGKAGNDYLHNEGDRAVIFGGDHGDIIENYGSNVFIHGDDTKSTVKSRTSDYIYTDKGDNVTIDGGAGNDLIEAWHDVSASIYGGAGNDRIHLYRVSTSDKKNILWKIAKIPAMDILYKSNKATEAFSTAMGSLENLSSLYKADNIASLLKGTAVTLGDIFLPVSSVLDIKSYVDELSLTKSTINGGAGDDTIVADGYAPRVFEYSAGEGNDVIYNFNANKTGKDSNLSTLEIKSGRIKNIAVNGGDVKFTVEKGSIKLVDGANKKFKLIEDDESKTASTRAYGTNPKTGEVVCSIFGSAKGDDLKDNVGIERDKTTYIRPYGSDSQYTVIGETFANVIYGYGGSDLLSGNDKNDTLFGGKGNDFLYGNAGDDYLDGGTGKDKLFGGEGNDTIKSYGDTVDAGTGDDSINNSGSSASIVAGADKDTVYSSGNSVTIDAGTGNDSIVSYGDKTSLVGGGDNDTIEAHGYKITIEGGAGNDSICAGSDGDTLSNANFRIKIVAGADNDTVISKNAYATIYGGNGDDLISLTSNAKYNYIEYAKGEGNDVIHGFNDDDTLKLKSGKVDAATVDGSDVVLTVGKGSIRMKKFKNKTFKLTASDGEIFKYRLSVDKKKKHLIGSIVGGKGQTTLYGTSGAEIYSGSKYGDLIYGNEGKDMLWGKGGNDTIYGGDNDDTLYGNGGTNTLVGGKGNDMIYAFGKGDYVSYTSGEGDDTVTGSGTVEILGAGYSSVASEGNMILYVGDGSVKLINNAKGKLFKVLGTCLNKPLPKGVSMNGNTMKITAKFKDAEIDLGYYPSAKAVDASKASQGLKIIGNDSTKSFKGSKYSDVIQAAPPSASNVSSNDLIFQSDDSAEDFDAVTISAGGGNDTIYGNEDRANVYSYASGDGNDLIRNFSALDTLSIGGSYSVKKSGKTFVVTVGDGKISLSGAATLSAVHINDDLILTNATSSTVKVDSSVKNIDASSRTKKIKITGNALANSIIGTTKNDTLSGGNGNDKLFGGAGNDSLDGGKDDDSLWGGAGADKFIYSLGGGKDVIYGFANEDTLTLDSLDFTTSYSKSTKTVSFGFDDGGSVRLKNFTATTFHVNNDVYQISGSKFRKQ